jgi:curved DNA-binding protein CbpA
MEDYYSSLEVEPGASADEIKSNYRRLAMKWHPDRNPGSKEAEDRFKKIGEAYSVLSDEAKRRDYDAYRAGGAMPGMGYGQAGQAGAPYGGFQDFEGFDPFAAFGGFARFTAEQAAFMFMQEMEALAVELTLQKLPPEDIARELERRGCPAETAAGIAAKFQGRRKEIMRSRAKLSMRNSLVLGGLGLLVGFWGFGFFGLLGLGVGAFMVIASAWNILRELWHLALDKVPGT